MAHAKSFLFEEKEKLFSDYNHALGHPARPHYWTFYKKRRVSAKLVITTTPIHAHPTAT